MRVESLESRCLLAADTVTILAGGGVDDTHDNGDAATSLKLLTPIDVAVDSAGNVYYTHADVTASEELVIKVDASTGAITKTAGGGADTTPNDGDLATDLRLLNPHGIAVDGNNDVYFSDTELDLIFRVDASSGQIKILAGGGDDGTINTGDLATGLNLVTPGDLAVDSVGDVYFAHSEVAGDRQIVKIDVSSGLVETIAGGGTDATPNDGDVATSLLLNAPGGVALDSGGNVYFTDTSRDVVVKVDIGSGLIDVLAGGGGDTSLNNGDVATSLDLTTPVDVAVDRNDVVSFTHREGPIGSTGVFRIDPVNGQITQLAGGGTDIEPNDGDSSTDLSLFTPNGLTFDQAGNLVFVDTGETMVIQVGDFVLGPGPLGINVTGDVRIEADGNDLVVRQGVNEVFRADGTTISEINVTGSNSEDAFELGDLSTAFPTGVPITFAAGSGADTFRLTESNQLLDLTGTDVLLGDIEIVDIVGASENNLIIDAQSVLDSTDGNNVLQIIHDEDDTVVYSGADWDVLQPIFVNGQRHVLANGDALVEVINTLPHQNPLFASDVNLQEDASSLDALLIINFLSRFDSVPVDLFNPLTADELPTLYVDVNGSRTASALDALLVINLLGRLSSNLESEALSQVLSVPYAHASNTEDVLRDLDTQLFQEKRLTGVANASNVKDSTDRLSIVSLDSRSQDGDFESSRIDPAAMDRAISLMSWLWIDHRLR